MKFSIVTISFNQGRFLEQAIRSVVEQDYPDIEYIVVDPGSTDGSRDIIERYRDKIDKVIFEPDNGPADGLNNGFSQATGEIFGFLNSDDVLLPGALTIVSKAFHRKPQTEVISGNAFLVDEQGKELRKLYSSSFSLLGCAHTAAILMQQSTFFLASAYHRTDGFNPDNDCAWDDELWVDMAMTGARFSRINNFLSWYRIYPESFSGSLSLKNEFKLYSERTFVKIMGRERIPTDRVVRWAMKTLEYIQKPRAFIDRITKGRTIG